LVRDGETYNAEGFFVPLAPLVIFLLDFLTYNVGDLGFLVFCESSFILGNGLLDFLLRKQHAALERPVLVIVITKLFDPIAASMRILG
jgi:hypothetical protein